jgi:hypothetical protein
VIFFRLLLSVGRVLPKSLSATCYERRDNYREIR